MRKIKKIVERLKETEINKKYLKETGIIALIGGTLMTGIYLQEKLPEIERNRYKSQAHVDYYDINKDGTKDMIIKDYPNDTIYAMISNKNNQFEKARIHFEDGMMFFDTKDTSYTPWDAIPRNYLKQPYQPKQNSSKQTKQ